jgi:hypothetical protein
MKIIPISDIDDEEKYCIKRDGEWDYEPTHYKVYPEDDCDEFFYVPFEYTDYEIYLLRDMYMNDKYNDD